MPGTVYVRRGVAAQPPSISSEEGEAGILKCMVDKLPQVPDTSIVGSQRVMMGGNVPPKIGMSYVEPESVKLTEDPVYHPGPRPVLRPRKSRSAVKHSMTEVVEHSLQVAVQEFKKILDKPPNVSLNICYNMYDMNHQ